MGSENTLANTEKFSKRERQGNERRKSRLAFSSSNTANSSKEEK